MLANFFFVPTIPSWLNEKAPTVSVASAVTIAVTYSTLLYVAIGLLGAYSAIVWNGSDLVSSA